MIKTINICNGNERSVNVEINSDIGNREEQQDCCCTLSVDGGFFAAVCDGMGGMEQGRVASQAAVSWLLENVGKKRVEEDFASFFLRIVDQLDERIYLLGEGQRKLHAGTTLSCVGVSGNRLYWLSVGDSRIYVCRGEEFVCLTRDHNYFLELNEWKEQELITEEQYESEAGKGEALISYLGMGGVEVYDLSREPLELLPGDLVLLATDGLWKAVDDKRMRDIMCAGNSLKVKKQLLSDEARRHPGYRDNMTYIILQITDDIGETKV